MITRRSILAFMGLTLTGVSPKVISKGEVCTERMITWLGSDIRSTVIPLPYKQPSPLLLEAVLRFQSTSRGELLS